MNFKVGQYVKIFSGSPKERGKIGLIHYVEDIPFGEGKIQQVYIKFGNSFEDFATKLEPQVSLASPLEALECARRINGKEKTRS